VFRGSFQIGILGALSAIDLMPDLIVGASVGTIMGAALAKLVHAAPDRRTEVLKRLVELFLHVDQRVAKTDRLKRALKELSARTRSVRISPRDVNRAFEWGIKADPGYASLGVPSVLVDAVARALALPRAALARAGRTFGRRDTAGAARALGAALQRYGLPALGIEDPMMGSALLQKELTEVLNEVGGEIGPGRQPFHGCEFYGTTSQLGSEEPVLLGQDEVPNPGAPYSVVEGCLASSAFPVVFRPRRASDLFPGYGRPDERYGDGGMFDNLPFIPAIEILADRQCTFGSRNTDDAVSFLKKRHERLHLFIVGAFDPDPAQTPFEPDSGLVEIWNRSAVLRSNIKTRGVVDQSERVHSQIERLLRGTPAALASVPRRHLDLLLDGAVLSIFPSDEEHLNPTFAFCRTMGLDHDRILRSIANGCFRTLARIAEARQGDGLVAKALQLDDGAMGRRVAEVAWRSQRGSAPECQYFTRDGRPFECPFMQAGSDAIEVRTTCVEDHQHERERPATKA